MFISKCSCVFLLFFISITGLFFSCGIAGNDFVLISSNADNIAALDPALWESEPVAIGISTISMSVVAVQNVQNIEYQFEALTEGGHDSGWQSSTFYVDRNLAPTTEYTYRVKARIALQPGNESEASSAASATTLSSIREPIIHLDMEGVGGNINGPSLIRIPDWIVQEDRADPSAIYYLYFANHGGNNIRMAWAENVLGPYTMWNPGEGVLTLELNSEHLSAGYHIASPDVIVDDENECIVMYFHGDLFLDEVHPKVGEQSTGVATSRDGLNFNNGIVDTIICPFYARIFSWGGELFAFINQGNLWKARDLEHPWENPPPGQVETVDIIANGGLWEWIGDDGNLWDDKISPFEFISPNIRHLAVMRSGNILHVFYSRYGMAPEHIEYSSIDLSVGEGNWVATDPISVLEPTFDWEGADLPIETSGVGGATGVRQLRDPYIFKDADDSVYLLYSGRGEEAIGIVLLEDISSIVIE